MNKKRIILDDKGFTLMECIMSMCLILIVMFAVIQITVYSANAYTRQRIQSEQLTVLESIERQITDNLRYVTEIKLSNPVVLSTDIDSSTSNVMFTGPDKTFRYIEEATVFTDSKILAGGTMSLGYSVEVLYKYYASDVLEVMITVYDDNNNVTKQNILCRLMNQAVSGSTGLQYADGIADYYNVVNYK